MPASTGYWCSLIVLAVALAAGFLPGPPPSPHSDGSPPGTVIVRLRLRGCVPDLSTQTGAALKRALTLAEVTGEALRACNAGSSANNRVDESNLLTLKKQYPDENEGKLARFLVARKHDLQAAIEMLEGERSLRRELGALEPVLALPFLSANLLYFAGFAM
jgi:hypothetical protein